MDECSLIATLHLVIPEIVRGERLYQMVSYVQSIYPSVTAHLQTPAAKAKLSAIAKARWKKTKAAGKTAL